MKLRAVQRQLTHLLAQHDVANFAVLRIQVDGRGLYVHHFRGGTYLQPHSGICH